MSAEIVAVYCDGGVIKKNPSPIGGTWAWCGVNSEGVRVVERGGVVPVNGIRLITNNHTEQMAICKALEEMPDGWSGIIYSDSQVALGRVLWGWSTKNLPQNVIDRTRAAVARLGPLKGVLLQGHPTKADLERGIGAKRSLPVSVHNVWCDEECGRQSRAYVATLEEKENA
jgi:ribonuclease HI